MIERRVLLVALVILVAGIATTVLGARMRPDASVGLVGLYGPSEGRYDASADTTLLVRATCSHCSPESAYIVRGDARHVLEKERFFLKSDAKDAWERTPVEPYTTRDGLTVSEAYVEPFEAVDPSGRLALLVVGLALGGIGAAMWLHAVGLASHRSALAGALGGFLLGWQGATLGEGGLAVIFLAILLVPVGLVLAAFRRTRRHAAGPVLAAVLAVEALLLLHAFYPAPPAL